MEFDKEWLNTHFKEFKEISHLLTKGCDGITKNKGIYTVVRESKTNPNFNIFNQHYMKKGIKIDLDYKKGYLIKVWNELSNHHIIYIGKANGKEGLKKRINDYIRFGKKTQEKIEKNGICHRGGRAIWQLDDYKELKIYWKESDSPRTEEKELIANFKKQNNGNRPFANRSD